MIKHNVCYLLLVLNLISVFSLSSTTEAISDSENKKIISFFITVLVYSCERLWKKGLGAYEGEKVI